MTGRGERFEQITHETMRRWVDVLDRGGAGEGGGPATAACELVLTELNAAMGVPGAEAAALDAAQWWDRFADLPLSKDIPGGAR